MKPGFCIANSRRKRLTYNEKISMLKNHVSMETILQSRSPFDYYLHKVKSQQMEKHVQRLHKLQRRQSSHLMSSKSTAYKSFIETMEMFASQDRRFTGNISQGARKQCIVNTDDTSVISSVDVSKLTIYDETPKVRNIETSDEVEEQFSTSKHQNQTNYFSEEDKLLVRFSRSNDLKPEPPVRQETSLIGEFPNIIRKRKAYVPRKYQSPSASTDNISEKSPVLTTSPDLQPFMKLSRRLLKLETSRGCQTDIAGLPQTSTINTWSLYNTFQQFMKSKNRSKGIFTVSEFTKAHDVAKDSRNENSENVKCKNGGKFEVTREGNDLPKADYVVPNVLNDTNKTCIDKEYTQNNNIYELLPTSAQSHSQLPKIVHLQNAKEIGGELRILPVASSPKVLQQQPTKHRKVDMYLYLPPKCFNQPDLITVVKLSSTDKNLV